MNEYMRGQSNMKRFLYSKQQIVVLLYLIPNSQKVHIQWMPFPLKSTFGFGVSVRNIETENWA